MGDNPEDDNTWCTTCWADSYGRRCHYNYNHDSVARRILRSGTPLGGGGHERCHDGRSCGVASILKCLVPSAFSMAGWSWNLGRCSCPENVDKNSLSKGGGLRRRRQKNCAR